MIISEDYNFIFVHVPKTGGNSVNKALEEFNSSRHGRPYGVGMHRYLSTVDKKTRWDKFAFGFVRNPWDRICSMYHFRVQKKNASQPPEKELLIQRGFEKSVLMWEVGPDQQEQMNYLEGCDFIGRFETLQYDLNHICDVIGIERRRLEHLNSSEHKDYRTYYTPEMVEVVEKNNIRTIERFGYTFEDPDSI